jgi:hypothetical protein
MPITLLPSLILFSISKAVAPAASRMDPRYLNLLTALICPVSVTIPAPKIILNNNNVTKYLSEYASGWPYQTQNINQYNKLTKTKYFI